MPIHVYRNKADIARLHSYGGPAVQNAPLDMRQDSTVQNIQSITTGAEKLGTAYSKEINDQIEAQQAADILSEVNAYHDEVRVFEDNYRNNTFGKDARTATEDFDKFHKEQLNKRLSQFNGDPRQSALFFRQAMSVRRSSLDRGSAYAREQDEVYRADTTKAVSARFLQFVGENDDPVAINEERGKVNIELNALNPGRDLTATMAQLDQDVAVTQINKAVAKKDFKQAKAFLNSYKPALGSRADEMINAVEAARVTNNKEQGVALAQDLFHSGEDAGKAWDKIAKIKDKDERGAAMSQYSSLWTMKAKIDAEAYEAGAIEIRDSIDTQAPTDLAAAEQSVLSMPEETDVDRKVKKFATERINQWKASGGMNPLTDSGAYLGIREDIISGNLTTPEQIKADPRSAKITTGDLDGDLVKLLEETQATTDASINNAFKQAFGAAKWERLKSTNKDLAFNYLKQVKDTVRQTNRGQDTDYIQKVVDTLALQGRNPDGFINSLKSTFLDGDALAESIRSGEFSINDLKRGLISGSAPWLPDSVPSEFDAIWNDPSTHREKWLKLYKEEDEAKKAAFMTWKLKNIGPKAGS